MFAIQNIKTGKFLYGTDYRYRPPHQRTSKTKMLTYSSIAEAAHDFWVKRKCGKDYRIVVLKSVEVKRVIDYYDSKTSFNTKRISIYQKRHLPNYLKKIEKQSFYKNELFLLLQ